MPLIQKTHSLSSSSSLPRLLLLCLLSTTTKACSGSSGLLVGYLVMLIPDGPNADLSLQRICVYHFPSFVPIPDSKIMPFFFVSSTVRGSCILVSSLDNASAIRAAQDGAALSAALRQTKGPASGSTASLPKAELAPLTLDTKTDTTCQMVSAFLKKGDCGFPYPGQPDWIYLFKISADYSVDAVNKKICLQSTSVSFDWRKVYGQHGQFNRRGGGEEVENDEAQMTFYLISADGKAGPGKGLSEDEIRELTQKWAPDLFVDSDKKPVNPKPPKPPKPSKKSDVMAIVLWSVGGVVVGVIVVVVVVVCYRKRKKEDEEMNPPEVKGEGEEYK